ncbi:MAG: DUF5103 domain-containing protein [Saprospirales bacterium]|jgi:hypothetical protein|nr:DUF5103 domain-containing protein [Saprospirales bacterium]
MQIRILRCCLALGVFYPMAGAAQPADNPYNELRIYDADITAVQLHLRGAPLTFPMVELRAPNGTLVLEFDRLGADIRDYLYTLEHCNANWQRSELDDNEYIEGFTEDRLQNNYNSFNTLQQYVHFTLSLPNANMRWTKSGNYLLKVFDNTGEKRLVLVRRFLVVESAWSVATNFVKPVQVDKLNTHHEIDFTISTKGMRVQYPQKEVQAYVLQNGRWDTAIGPLAPFVVRQDQLVFDYQDKIVFPAGKEWRYFDMRTFDYRGEYIRDIRNRGDYYEVTLQMDESRANRSYIFYGDLNGRYSIENLNTNQGLEQCDYAEVLFSIRQNLPLEQEDVYVFGGLSDWQLKPEFKMRYEESVHAYVCEAYLKQGYYNYQYLVVDRQTGQPDAEGFEGNCYETCNEYQILVYYRPFGVRYDQLMVSATMDTRLR